MIKICGRFLQTLGNRGILNYPALGRPYSFQSDISLNVLYPNSKLSIFTPPPPNVIPGKFNGYIPLKEIDITYSCSSGPGGQHVNRVNTKVDIRFHVASASWISDATKDRLIKEHRSKINKDGCFVIKSDATRSQQMNLADALLKIRKILWALEKPISKPTVETMEKLRKRHEKACQERLSIKRERSEVKANRQPPSLTD